MLGEQLLIGKDEQAWLKMLNRWGETSPTPHVLFKFSQGFSYA